MWTNDRERELEKMLTNIENKATASLNSIRKSFEQSGESFHPAHQKYCIERVKDR